MKRPEQSTASIFTDLVMTSVIRNSNPYTPYWTVNKNKSAVSSKLEPATTEMELNKLSNISEQAKLECSVLNVRLTLWFENSENIRFRIPQIHRLRLYMSC